MGVKSSIGETDAPDGTTRPETDDDRETVGNPSLSPFLQNYETDEWQVDAETLNQLLTGVVAVTNLL